MKNTLCLNMIVKNESLIIRKVLESVADWIDYYVIEDTGSTDDTIKIIKDFFDSIGIEGEIHKTKWVNFGFNRTHSIKLAKNKGDYILLIDADMILLVEDKNFKEKLVNDMYSIDQNANGMVYGNVRIVKGDNDYEYIGVTHEFISCLKKDCKSSKLETVNMLDNANGFNRKDKYSRDASLLQDALQDKKLDIGMKQRYNFYLAQSYRDDKKYQKAIKYYKIRVSLEGWEEEVFYSLYQIGMLYIMQNDYLNGLDYLLRAYQMRPTRSESLYSLVKFYRLEKKYELSKLFLIKGMKIQIPKNDTLFIDINIYRFLFEYELTCIGYKTGDEKTGRLISEGLMHRKDVPNEIKQLVIDNFHNYSKDLKSFCPSFENFEYMITNCNNDKTYFRTTPSILYHEGNFLLNTRECNYDCYNEKYTEKDIIQTNNYLTWLEKDFLNNSFKDEKNKYYIHHLLRDNSNILKNNNRIRGYEDIRIFILNNELYAVATSVFTNENNINEIVLLKINNGKFNNWQSKDDFVIEKVIRLKSPKLDNSKKCEKNWLPLVIENELKLLYTSEPFLLLDCDLDTGFCMTYKVYENNMDFGGYRGSTPIIKVNEGYLYMIHQVGFDEGIRYYYHRFVHLDKDLRIIKFSPLFTFFENSRIEYCNGLCLVDDYLYITFSISDRKPYISRIKLDEVFNFLL
jgi:hypothetical protein